MMAYPGNNAESSEKRHPYVEAKAVIENKHEKIKSVGNGNKIQGFKCENNNSDNS